MKTPVGESFAVYDAKGNEIAGYLVVEDDGLVRFELRNPDHDPSKE